MGLFNRWTRSAGQPTDGTAADDLTATFAAVEADMAAAAVLDALQWKTRFPSRHHAVVTHIPASGTLQVSLDDVLLNLATGDDDNAAQLHAASRLGGLQISFGFDGDFLVVVGYWNNQMFACRGIPVGAP